MKKILKEQWPYLIIGLIFGSVISIAIVVWDILLSKL